MFHRQKVTELSQALWIQSLYSWSLYFKNLKWMDKFSLIKETDSRGIYQIMGNGHYRKLPWELIARVLRKCSWIRQWSRFFSCEGKHLAFVQWVTVVHKVSCIMSDFPRFSCKSMSCCIYYYPPKIIFYQVGVGWPMQIPLTTPPSLSFPVSMLP